MLLGEVGWITLGIVTAFIAPRIFPLQRKTSGETGRILPRFAHTLGCVCGFSVSLLTLTGRSLAMDATSQPSPDSAQAPTESVYNLDGTLKSLFAPRTEDIYFSPFDIMNPSHIRPDVPLQIGHYEDLHLYMGLQTVGRFQAITQNKVVVGGMPQSGLNPGLQDPFANLSFLATIPDKMDVYFDLYVASRPHPNTMYAHEGYLLFKQMPAPLDTGLLGDVFNYINVKVGAFDIDFGDGNYRRSNNAFVQRNPLIGNPLVDPNVEEIGGEVYTIKGPIYALFGLTNGTTTEHFDYGTEPAIHGKIWGNPLPEVRTSVSAYHVDLAGTNTLYETSDLYSAGRSGEPFGGIFGNGDDPGSILPQAGRDVTAVQGDVTWNHWPFEAYGNVGWTQDSDTNGPGPGHPAERWTYGTAEGVYHLTPGFYFAGRYGLADAESVGGVRTNGWVDRGELGCGYWLTNDVLIKAEGIYEQYHVFKGDTGTVSGVEAGTHPDFFGGIMEVSWSL
jgi:hypothetical protein